MKIQVIHCGRVAKTDLLPIVEDFKKRLGGFVRVDDTQLRMDPSGRDKRQAQKSSEPIITPGPGDFLIILDERGKTWNSNEFSQKMRTWIDDPRIKNLIFVIGPPYGFDNASKAVANELWSLSQLTMPSDMAWALVWEQVYRAYTIIKGMPYHHD